MAAPCTWDVDPEALGVCSDWADYPEAARVSALELSTLYLWAATGRRFGLCPLTVRPSQTDRTEVAYRAFPVAPGLGGLGEPGGPFLFGGRWFNGGCASACCGNSACAVVLRGPVAGVTEVVVDGDVIPPSAYRVDVTGGTYLLVRVDGACWPMCQNFRNDPPEEDTFEITYLIGSPVPDALLVAAALLACEYAKGLSGGACKLPTKMTRLSRQGVEVELESPNAERGETGIREVDDIVYALNPTRRQRPPVLLSLDLPETCDRVTVVPVGS
jgi:hypothetical protein